MNPENNYYNIPVAGHLQAALKELQVAAAATICATL